MVTTRQTSDSKVIAMEDQVGGAVAPPKTLLEEVNAHLICVLCRGYYIDATTIVECLHSFCRSCIVKHLKVKCYCPVCEMMINSAKPNIKPDKALQDIVYKLVPGLFQKEMQRRQSFYASRPGQAASATPEQRGEDTERIIFSPEDVISFSLEYMDCTEVESASSRSSESGNESAPCNEAGAPTRRYLQCPAVVNISHLKKFLSMKYDIDVTHFFVDILYKRVPLPDYYTLMDIAYIYNWKRNEPMRFFYQITDFGAIRDRFGFFGISRPGLLAHRKLSPSSGGGTAPGSPAHLTEASSDGSSGSYSPVPHHDVKMQSHFSQTSEKTIKNDSLHRLEDNSPIDECLNMDHSQSSPMDVEKSQFLNSFELTAKSCVNSGKSSSSPTKEENVMADDVKVNINEDKKPSTPTVSSKIETQQSPAKRKLPTVENSGNKKLKPTPEKPKDSPVLNFILNKPTETLLTKVSNSLASNCAPQKNLAAVSQLLASKVNPAVANKHTSSAQASNIPPGVQQYASKPLSKNMSTGTNTQLNASLDSALRKCAPQANKPLPVKRKLSGEVPQNQQFQRSNLQQKPEMPKHPPPNTKLPDNKPRPAGPTLENKPVVKPNAPIPKINITTKHSKPEIVKKSAEPNKELQRPVVQQKVPSLKPATVPKPKSQSDTLKNLLDSCKIPASLSITLTDQKLEPRMSEAPIECVDKPTPSSGQVATSQALPPNFQPKSPSPPQVHNSIEILKLPVSNNSEKATETENITKSLPSGKSTDPVTGAKGPVPNLKPISETKTPKGGPFVKPQTFQQTFLQSLQQHTEKPKYLKTRIDFPKINLLLNKAEEAANEANASAAASPAVAPVNKPKPVPPAQPIRKPNPILPKLTKPDSALDLSTPHTVQSQLGPQQAKALETMQSIANLAKRQSYTQRMTSPSQVFSQESFKMNTTNASPLRIPVPPPHTKLMKTNTSSQGSSTHSPKHFPEYFQPMKLGNMRTSNNGSPIQNTKSTQSQSTSSSYSQNSQRAQTRSPSSSPKLVIACPSPKSQSPEQKQLLSPRGMDSGSQSNMISSSQITSTNLASSSDSSTSKNSVKTVKSTKVVPVTKLAAIRGAVPLHKPGTSGNNSSTNAMLSMNPLFTQQAYLRHQLELQTQLGLLPPGAAAQWIGNPVARAHFENIMKNMTHNSQMPFSNNHNMKDNK